MKRTGDCNRLNSLRLQARTQSLGSALVVVSLCSTACYDTGPVLFNSQLSSISNAATAMTWHGAYPMDLGDVVNATTWISTASPGTPPPLYLTHASFYGSGQGPTNNYVPYRSYADYHLDFQSGLGAMVAGLSDGSHFRPFGRVYYPYSAGGIGWTPYGPQATFLDATSNYNSLVVALGLSPSGTGLSVFSDGSTPTAASPLFEPGAALLTGNGTWSGTVANTSLASVLNTAGASAPSTGFSPTSPAFGTVKSYNTNGTSSSLAWDNQGHAFYGYTDATQVGYLASYTAYNTWIPLSSPDATVPSSFIRLGPQTQQVQLLNDGYGVTPLWVGEDFVYADTLALGNATGCLLRNQALKCWGKNDTAQTGTVSDVTTTVPYPAAVGNLSGSITQVSLGDGHGCALDQSGNLACWGANSSGQLGINITSTDSAIPQAVALSGIARAVSAGGSHTCALEGVLSAGTITNQIFCWGDNTQGQLGNGTNNSATAPSTTAVTWPDGTYAPTAIITGSVHTCAMNANPAANNVYCWGDDSSGQLGDGGGGTQTSPVQITGGVHFAAIFGNGSSGAPGNNTTCALTTAGAAYCWGDDTYGQLGDAGGAVTSSTPLLIPGGLSFQTLAVGGDHVCGLTQATTTVASKLYCWGANGKGQMGTGATDGIFHAPTLVPFPLGLTPVGIFAGNQFSCALTHLGTVLCWGSNGTGQSNGNAVGTVQTSPLELPASAAQALHTSWTVGSDTTADSLKTLSTPSTGDVKSMAAATDGGSNVLVVYIQSMPNYTAPPSGSVVTSLPLRQNQYRVYASARGATGQWTGPTQIDDASIFNVYSTSVFQDALGRASGQIAHVTGGIEYFTPAVSYLGNGRFLAAFAMTDLQKLTSSIYVRGYTVGAGWDSSAQTVLIDSINLPTTAAEAYRFANELALVGDGQGDALLMAQVVVPSGDGSTVTLRNYGMKAYRYSAAQGAWTADTMLFPGSICTAPTSLTTSAVGIVQSYPCWNLKPQGMIFPGGESVVVYPAPYPASNNSKVTLPVPLLRLFSTELRL